MTKTYKKRSAQTKGENINVRLDPRTRFGLELLARKQRRTLSSVVEWAISNLMNSTDGLIEMRTDEETGLKYECDILAITWDIEEEQRLFRMKVYTPYLLTFEEEQLLKEKSDQIKALDNPEELIKK